jgi:hypothetical protein
VTELQRREPWRVKYDGTCSRCGTLLLRGAPAVWDVRARKMHCIECPTVTGIDSAAVALQELPIESGEAGGSARRNYERLQERRAAEVKGRWGDRVGGWVLRFSEEPHSIRAWGIGARGEEELAAAFEGVNGLRILNDRRVKGTRGNIDHILVAPAGVFVVDAKNYTGDVDIRNVGGWFRTELRLHVGGRDRSKLADQMGWQLAAVRAALGRAGIQPLPPVAPVLCFIGARWPRFRRIDEFEGVRLEDPGSLQRLLSEPVAMGEADIDRIAHAIAAALPVK